jgi:hypothetical protein
MEGRGFRGAGRNIRPPNHKPEKRTSENMKTSKENKAARLMSSLYAANVRPYRNESCRADYDAQRNLQGRTHYVDPDTLRGFQARILNGGHVADGLLYWILESVQSRPQHGGYTRRAIVFDVFGDIVNDRATLSESQGEWFRDTAKAEQAAAAFIAGFDAVKHTADKLAAKARRDIKIARETLAILAGKTPKP